MGRRVLTILLAAGLGTQATGLTLALHLHACQADHDEHHCPTCQLLIHAPKALPPDPAPIILDRPAGPPLVLPVASVHPIRPDNSPHAPRAPPQA